MDEKPKFGELSAEELNIGDIVEWSRWDSENSEWEYNYGIITRLSNEIRSNRMVSISRVLPLNEPAGEIEFFTLSLRLISQINEE